MFTYVIVRDDVKIHSIKRRELSDVIITVHGSCWLVECIQGVQGGICETSG